MTVAVPTGSSRRLYEIDRRAGVARYAGESTDGVIRPIGRLVVRDDVMALRVLPDGGEFVVVLDTCDGCAEAYEGAGVTHGRLRFCDAVCRDKWRFERGEMDT